MNLLDKPEEQNRNTKAEKGRDVFPSPADPKCYRCHGDHQHKSCPLRMQFAIIVRRAAIFGGLVENEAKKHIDSTPQ